MERRFVVEAKSFFFSARKGSTVLRLEEKRKGFGGFILLGFKCSVWLADVVGEAMVAQRKEDFARMCSEGERVVKVRMGSNTAGCFLEVAVFVEGSRKGVIRIPEGRGGWGWQRFADEVRSLVVLPMETTLPEVSVETAGEVGSVVSAAVVTAVLPGGQKPTGCSLEEMKSLAIDLLARVRAEVDRVIFFGLGLKVEATRANRKRLGRVLSRMGLKPKLLFGSKLRARRSRKDSNAGVVWAPDSGQGKGETSPEKTPVARESSARFDVGSVVRGCSELVPEKGLTSTEGVEESPVPMGSTQIVPETILIATEAAAIPEKTSPEIDLVFSSMEMPIVTQRSPALLVEGSVTMGSNQIVPEKCLTLTEGLEESPIVLRCHEVPEPQLLVNGLTESQAWFLGWMRENTRCNEVLAAIDRMEEKERRKNEVVPPPVCSMELPQLKAKLEAGIRVANRETVVRFLALSGC
jgi:hypothetical protein